LRAAQDTPRPLTQLQLSSASFPPPASLCTPPLPGIAGPEPRHVVLLAAPRAVALLDFQGTLRGFPQPPSPSRSAPSTPGGSYPTATCDACPGPAVLHCAAPAHVFCPSDLPMARFAATLKVSCHSGGEERQ